MIDTKLFSTKQRVLIIKIGALGDVALALSLIKAYEKSNITWVVGQAALPLLKLVPQLSSLIAINEQALLKGNFFQKLCQIILVWWKLGLRRYDVIITAHKDPRYRLLSLLTLKKKHYYFSSCDAFPLGKKFHGQAYLDLAKASCPLEYPLLRLPSLNLNALSGIKQPWIVLNIFGQSQHNKQLRYWSIESYVQLASLLSKNHTVILIGDATANDAAKAFSSLNIINLLGQTTLEQLIYLLQQSYCLITHDSGPFHLARVARCRRACLFGPTHPNNFGRESEDELHIYTSFFCSPCYDGKKFPSCQENMCLKTISPQLVYESLKKRFAEIR